MCPSKNTIKNLQKDFAVDGLMVAIAGLMRVKKMYWSAVRQYMQLWKLNAKKKLSRRRLFNKSSLIMLKWSSECKECRRRSLIMLMLHKFSIT